MSIIINPNAPQQPKQERMSELQVLVDTMRVIASFRRKWLDLEAAKQGDGVTEITASEILTITDAQRHILEDMCRFILYGK